jgi:hypothetical protein
MRGLLGEYGVILPQGARRFLVQARDAIAGAELSDLARELFIGTLDELEAVRNPSMGRFRHRSLHVELKDGFRAAATACRLFVSRCRAHGFHNCVVFIGRPITLEILEEWQPVVLEAIFIKIADRERKAVVDADQRRAHPRRDVSAAIRRCRTASLRLP